MRKAALADVILKPNKTLVTISGSTAIIGKHVPLVRYRTAASECRSQQSFYIDSEHVKCSVNTKALCVVLNY